MTKSAFMDLLWKSEISRWKLSLQSSSLSSNFLPHESPAPCRSLNVLVQMMQKVVQVVNVRGFSFCLGNRDCLVCGDSVPPKKVIRINRFLLYLKLLFYFFKHLAYCIYFDVSQIACLTRYQSLCQLLMLLPFSSSSWQSTMKVVSCSNLQQSGLASTDLRKMPVFEFDHFSLLCAERQQVLGNQLHKMHQTISCC